MKTFMSITDLDKLADDDPAKPVVSQLLEWLTAPGEFPDQDPISRNHCILANDLGTAASVLVDPAGNVLVAQSGNSRVERFRPPFPTAPNAEGGCGEISVDVYGRESPKCHSQQG